MSDTIIILKGKSEIDFKSLKKTQNKIFALDYESHKMLENNLIMHEIADVQLNEDDLVEIFNKSISLYDWHKFIPKEIECEIDNFEFFNILDSAELHAYVINILYDFVMIKKIIEKEMPRKIIVSESLKETIIPFQDKIEFDFITSNKVKDIVYDEIQIRFNLGKFPISFNISRKNYLKLKKNIEKVIWKVYKLTPDNEKKESVLLIEINPNEYEELIKEFSRKNIQILILNNRKPAVWDRKSLQIIKKYDCKILGLETLLSNEDKKNNLINLQKIKKNIQLLRNFDKEIGANFLYDNTSYWKCIEKKIIETYENRCEWYVLLIKGVSKILQKYNIVSIFSLNVIGETEKSVLGVNNNNIPSVMLVHAFDNYSSESAKYDILSMYSLFKDKIAVWGHTQKEYLQESHRISDDRIILSGSPRHDKFFSNKHSSIEDKKIILITPRPIIDTAIHKKVELYKRYEKVLKEIINHLKNFKEYQIAIKIHPGLDLHSTDIKKIIKNIDSSIPIYQNTSIQKLIEQSWAHINISPEGFDVSTVVMESVILGVPSLNVILDQKIFDYEINRMNAILNCTNMSELDHYLDNLILDKKTRDSLNANGKNFLRRYLSNHGNASKYLVDSLEFS